MKKISGIMILVVILIESGQIAAQPTSISNNKMTNASLDKNGNLVITPSGTSSSRDFDFLMGNHNVHHKFLTARLEGTKTWAEFDGTHQMQPLLGGKGNLEQHQMTDPKGNPVEGVAFRLFNPVTRLWSIYWADSRTVTMDVPVVGSFENGIGYFYAKDVFNNKPVLIQFKWDASNPGKPVWSQAFSTDNGETWEWNWYMYFTKK
ncbi:hypothetical protein KK083_14750 [Fulvivirgaceae bacterium PWU4]|uniref:DUF1579 domain-containing protein n=1 Tax=Chryseosolibacter histidini TaxID=2782349 RepID=A0AAP2DMD9_9BACT|nr:hypothetical protein [Chryseosolibacter histidini]MBT1698149.1 hypothetical protein [Chryseosolibacter histidini]